MVDPKKENESEDRWVQDVLTDFESLHPGLIEKLSIMATQNQVRLSMYPQQTQGGASCTTEETA